MKKNCLLSMFAASVLALGAVAIAANSEQDKKPSKEVKAEKAEIGKPAPAFTLTTAEGKSVSLSDFAGKTVVLEWFSPYCPWSGMESDDSYWSTGRAAKVVSGIKQADPDAVYLCINSNFDGYDGKSASENGKDSMAIVGSVGVPVLLDLTGVVGKAYGAKSTPHVFIVNTKGVLAYIGAPTTKDGKELFAVEAVKAIKEGKDPKPAETKNYGCGVKYQKKA